MAAKKKLPRKKGQNLLHISKVPDVLKERYEVLHRLAERFFKAMSEFGPELPIEAQVAFLPPGEAIFRADYDVRAYVRACMLDAEERPLKPAQESIESAIEICRRFLGDDDAP